MASQLSSEQVVLKLGLTGDFDETFRISGVTPKSVLASTQVSSYYIFGITPEAFINDYAATQFNYSELCRIFSLFCKDFSNEIMDGVESRALEFSSKILFEVGPQIKNEKKSKGDKSVRFRFPYAKDVSSGPSSKKELSIRTVIVSTFRESHFVKNAEDDKLVLTFKQAGLLAMDTFMKAVSYSFNKNGSILLTPLCGAVFSRDSVAKLSEEIGDDQKAIVQTINASTCSGGQHLVQSDMACAVVAAISATRRVTNAGIRDQIISKTVKQYAGAKKEFISKNFDAYCKYALGGVPAGLDSETLILKYTNIQASEASLRAAAKVVQQSVQSVDLKRPQMPTASSIKPSFTYSAPGRPTSPKK